MCLIGEPNVFSLHPVPNTLRRRACSIILSLGLNPAPEQVIYNPRILQEGNLQNPDRSALPYLKSALRRINHAFDPHRIESFLQIIPPGLCNETVCQLKEVRAGSLGMFGWHKSVYTFDAEICKAAKLSRSVSSLTRCTGRFGGKQTKEAGTCGTESM